MPDPLIVSPGPTPQTVRTPDGRTLTPPPDWLLVPPGDPALTRRLKLAGPTWLVQETVRRKLMSRGLWAPRATVDSIKSALEQERADPSYAKKQQAAATRREKTQSAYVESFEQSVLNFLNFHPRHAPLAHQLARLVAAHATPVGSGTVARTERIPIEQRAQAAVIAWMRHQTTAYDSMPIPRIKGKRREVRRQLAARSSALLSQYRASADPHPACPLARALKASDLGG